MTATSEPEHSRSVFADPNFRLFFAATAVRKTGLQVSYLAVPLVAILALDASPGQVGLLAVFQTIAFLIIGLPAGAWVDRVKRRPVMVSTDIIRALLFTWIPVGWWLHVLTIAQLYAVVLLAGVATVFSEVATQSYLPSLVGRAGLISANAKLVSVDAANQIAGRSVGGFLIQLLSAPAAIIIDAASYAFSAVSMLLIRFREPVPERAGKALLGRQINEGLRFVFGNPLLRALALVAALTNLSVNLSIVMIPVLFTRELGLSPGVYGLYLGAGGVGVLLGSTTARRVGGWLGNGRSQWILALATLPFAFLTPLIQPGVMLWLGGLAWLVTTYRIGVGNVIQVSLRQRVTPDRMLGRMNATMRFLLTGAIAVGGGLSGLIGQAFSVRAALWVGAAGLALVWIPVYFSPMRHMRDLPPEVTDDEPTPATRSGLAAGAAREH